MASGAFGRRPSNSHFSDHTLFTQNQYPITGAGRALTNDLQSVWHNVLDTKDVLQKLEHRVEATEDGKKDGGLCLSTSEWNVTKKVLNRNQRRIPSATVQDDQSRPVLRSVGHKVSFHEPVVSYNAEFDPLHGNYSEQWNSLNGAIVPTRMLNEAVESPQKNKNTDAVKRVQNIKSAGVAVTVRNFDADQVYKYLQKEVGKDMENAPSSSGTPASGIVTKSPLFHTSPYGPCKDFDIVKQRKKMKQNSEALERLKEKIQRQKLRSPLVGMTPVQKPNLVTDDLAIPSEINSHAQKEKPLFRKTARGPTAPEYKGFSRAEPLKSAVHPDKKLEAVSSIFESDDTKLKRPIFGRPKQEISMKRTKNKSLKVERKIGTTKTEIRMPKKTTITPSSWREGQRIAESILGPPPKQAKKAVGQENQRPDSPPTRDTSATLPQKNELHSTAEQTSGNKILRVSANIKASIPKNKLSMEARAVLDDLQLSSSESDSEKKDGSDHTIKRSREKSTKESCGRHERGTTKLSRSKDVQASKNERFRKVRHYDQSEVQQYMVRQKAVRKKKQSQEKKAHKVAQQRRQKQLEELYRKQKVTATKKCGECEAKGGLRKQVDMSTVIAIENIDECRDAIDSKSVEVTKSDRESLHSTKPPLARYHDRMTAFMAKLDQYETNLPFTSTCKPQNEEPGTVPIGATSQSLNEPMSEFMQKLDHYLKEETPVIAASEVSGPTQGEIKARSLKDRGNLKPDVSVEEFGTRETSPYHSEVSLPQRLCSGNSGGMFSPRYQEMMSSKISEESVLEKRTRAERIAALKVKAETLQERIETESQKLSQQPIIPVKPQLEEINMILAKSGHGQSLPVYSWKLDTRIGASMNTSLDWRASTDQRYTGVDLPDAGQPRAGLTDISPSQLSGVAGLRKHVIDVAENKAEKDAALEVQSASEDHNVRYIKNEWKSDLGSSFTEVRRQGTSVLSLEGDAPGFEEDHDDVLTSRRSDSPIKFRSVEEILADMKKKEYCVACPPSVDELCSSEWTTPATDSPRSERSKDFLSELREESGTSLRFHDLRQQDDDKPPWQRSGGDRYSVVNVFTNEYLKTVKKKTRHELPQVASSREDESKLPRKSETLISQKYKSEHVPPSSSYAEHFATSSKESQRSKSETSDKYCQRFDDTAHDVPEFLSPPIEDVPKAHSKLYDKKRFGDTTVPETLDAGRVSSPTEVLAGRVSYGSDSESSIISNASLEKAKYEPAILREPDRIEKSDISFDKSSTSMTMLSDPLKFHSIPASYEKRFSPAALEQKMSAELNYQEAIEESLRHLSSVERTHGVSLAQQETVSLAQLMKARQLQYDVEIEQIAVKAKKEALDLEWKKEASRADENEKRSKENLKIQVSRKGSGSRDGAAQAMTRVVKQPSHAFKQKPPLLYGDSYSVPSSEQSSMQGSFSSDLARPRDQQSESSSDFEKEDEKSLQTDSTASEISEHIGHASKSNSILEQSSSTEGADDKISFEKFPKGQVTSHNTSATDSILDERPRKKSQGQDSDKLIAGSIVYQQKQDKEDRKKQFPSKTTKDLVSDNSETSSVHFDESLTEGEIAEISRRAVVPSEGHRQRQRLRSPHSLLLDGSDISSDDQPSMLRQRTPRSIGHRGLDEFTIGPSLSGAVDSEFVLFMDKMVQQYMVEEEVRSRHQAAMLKLRERAIKEKTEAELACLEKMKKQVRNKGEDEKMPPIKKKQRAILRKFKLETDEIKKLKAATKTASQERRLFLQQHKENSSRRSKLKGFEDKPGVSVEEKKLRKDIAVEPLFTSSTLVPNLNLSTLPEMDISESNSELDISSTSSILLKKLKTRPFDKHRLTKREQRLMQRKKQAEQLIAWKKRLDQEEKKVCDIEKQALSAWEKEGGSKSDRGRRSIPLEGSSKNRKDADPSLRGSSGQNSPESEHHSSPLASHSESSIAEEIIPVHSGTNSSGSAVLPGQNRSHRNQEESSDGTNADDCSQSFESAKGSQRTTRSTKSQDKGDKSDKSKDQVDSIAEARMLARKGEKRDEREPGDTNSPSTTPLLQQKKGGSSRPLTAFKIDSPGVEQSSHRRESAESWSDESFSQTQSETEQSDIECRVRALKEELKRRRMIAEKLKREQKRRHKDRLKAQEASLISQIEAYDVFIRKTKNELTQELDNQLHLSAPMGPVAKPQIRSPRKTEQARHSARGLRSTTASVVSPEASPRSGSHGPHAILGKHHTDSESSGKSSRSLSFDEEERPDEAPFVSTKSIPGVVGPLPSKHQEKILSNFIASSSQQAMDGLSSGGSTPTEKRLEKPKRLDLTAAVATLSKLATKPSSPNGSASSSSATVEKVRSHIPVVSKSSPSASSKMASPPMSSPKPLSPQPSKKSLIPLPVSSREPSAFVATVFKETATSVTPTYLPSEKSFSYTEDFDSSASKKTDKDSSITADVDISEHFSDVSVGSEERSDKSGAMLDLAIPFEKTKESLESPEDDSLHDVEEIKESKEVQKESSESEDDEKTPVISPVNSPTPSSPKTPTPEIRDSTALHDFDVGDHVLLAGRESGVVRFIGETSFAPGVWVGAELQKPNGKNDGSVHDVRYFTCAPKYGIFAPISRVSLLSPKSESTSSSKSSSLQRFEYGEDALNTAKPVEPIASEIGGVASGESLENFKAFDKGADTAAKTEPSSKKDSSATSELDRTRLADELSDKLLSSLLEDTMTHLLGNHADKRQRQLEGLEDDLGAKKRRKEDFREEVKTQHSSDEEGIALSVSTRRILEMLASSPEQTGQTIVEEAGGEVKTKEHESLADTFTGDLLQDTLTKVLEIRRQRSKKWQQMEREDDFNEAFNAGEDIKLDDGREVEDILEEKNRKHGVEDEVEEKESTTPVRPVSPIFGASQDEGLEEWFEDDIGIASFHKKKPTLNKEDMKRLNDEEDFWQDGRLIEVLSNRVEPPPPPPNFVVPHRPEHIMRLVEDAVDYYYSQHLRGELTSDTQIPDFLFKDKSDELSDKDCSETNQEKKDSDVNANYIFKTSLFDMVREIITEVFSSKNYAEELSQGPTWLKKKPIVRPSYCRRPPKTAEELLAVVSKQVGKLLNLSGNAYRLDPRITMKWGSRKKKDKVDLILIQELREEEPEWTNYDEDETTVKMQLTHAVLDMLLSDTVKCLDSIERTQEKRRSVVVPTAGECIDIEERT